MNQARASWAAWALVLASACGGAQRRPVVAAPLRSMLPPAPAPAPRKVPPPRSPLPVPGGHIGTAHPIVVMAAGANAQWVSFCQARVDTDGNDRIEVYVGGHGSLGGDTMQPYLALGAGAGTPIDEFVGASPSGGHLVVIRDRRLVLIDSASRTEVDLSARQADLRDDGSALGRHRAAEFSDDDERVLYMRHGAAGDAVVVRELSTGSEIVIPAGPGSLWRAEFAPGGRWVTMRVVPNDDDGDEPDWPVVLTNRSVDGRRCGGPGSYGTYGLAGDKPVERYARVTGGPAITLKDVEAALGDGLIRRAKDGALFVDAGGGKVTPFAPASCGGKVLAVDPASGHALVACASLEEAQPGGGTVRGVPMWVVGGASETPLKPRMSLIGLQLWGRTDVGRFRPTRDAYTDALYWIDLKTGRAAPLPEQSGVFAWEDPSRIHIVQGGRIFRMDVAQPKKMTTRSTGVKHVARVAGSLAVLVGEDDRPRLLDTSGDAPAVPLEGSVHALTPVAALVAPHPGQQSGCIDNGPLRWAPPR